VLSVLTVGLLAHGLNMFHYPAHSIHLCLRSCSWWLDNDRCLDGGYWRSRYFRGCRG
jgi:hypothetical protein